MKKLLFVLVIAAFAACNEGTTTEATADSTVNAIENTAEQAVDSINAHADSAMNVIDSIAH
jgi:hypothetical protein